MSIRIPAVAPDIETNTAAPPTASAKLHSVLPQGRIPRVPKPPAQRLTGHHARRAPRRASAAVVMEHANQTPKGARTKMRPSLPAPRRRNRRHSRRGAQARRKPADRAGTHCYPRKSQQKPANTFGTRPLRELSPAPQTPKPTRPRIPGNIEHKSRRTVPHAAATTKRQGPNHIASTREHRPRPHRARPSASARIGRRRAKFTPRGTVQARIRLSPHTATRTTELYYQFFP